MGMRYSNSAFQSKLLEVPVDADPKQALLVVQKNFDIVWKTLKDIIGRMDSQSK